MQPVPAAAPPRKGLLPHPLLPGGAALRRGEPGPRRRTPAAGARCSAGSSGHNACVNGQGPALPPAAAPQAPAAGFADALQNLGWVDVTALSLLAVFFVVGLFKGFLWQVSRVGILVVAYAAAASFGADLAQVLLDLTSSGPEPPNGERQSTAFYVACVLIFLAVLIALSLFALLLQKLVKKAGMTFYDRLGGGLVGVGTGAVVVVFLLALVFMFFPKGHVAEAAGRSHSLDLSRRLVDQLGPVVPAGLQGLFAPPAGPQPGGPQAGGPQAGDAPAEPGAAPQPPAGHQAPGTPPDRATPPAAGTVPPERGPGRR